MPSKAIKAKTVDKKTSTIPVKPVSNVNDPLLKYVDMDMDLLHRYPNNPRRNKEAISAVAASLLEFGWQQPIVVDKDLVIVVGDTRYQAAQSLGWTRAPVQIADKLTQAQITAYRMADNRVGEISQWDDERLFKELQAVMEEGFDLKGFGFTDAELKEYAAPQVKEDLRYLEDFEVMPKPKPAWLLISADADEIAEIAATVKGMKLPTVKLETTLEPSTDLDNKSNKK